MSGFNFTEIYKLKDMLEKAGIPFVFRKLYEGYQIVYPSDDRGKRICDAVIHFGSYGHEEGLLEIMGLVNEEEIGDSVEGYLTAEEVFGRIEKHYQENRN